MFLNLKNFFQVIIVLLKTKYIFKKPKTKKIIIFDNKGANTPYYKLFENNDCEILNVQGETLNIYVALLVLLNLKALSLKNYIEQYIRLLKPKFIFHNSFNKRFFELNNKDFKFNFEKIFTQSELKNHHDYNEFLNGKENLSCDYLFVWSEGMKKLMQKNITGKYFISGSFFNNEVPKINLKNLKNKLVFVSQYRTFKKYNKNDTKKTIRNEYHGLKFSWEQFYSADLDVADKLKKYCLNKNITFEVIGSSIYDKENEKLFFESRLGKDNWKFIESSQEKRGIFLTATAKYIITIDSTLGYECLSRGQRVGFFSVRPKYLKTNYARFGWPLNLEEEGKCWTTNNTTEDFNRIMNFLVNEDDNEWQKILNYDLKDLVFYNQKNSIYKNFLKEHNIINDTTN